MDKYYRGEALIKTFHFYINPENDDVWDVDSVSVVPNDGWDAVDHIYNYMEQYDLFRANGFNDGKLYGDDLSNYNNFEESI